MSATDQLLAAERALLGSLILDPAQIDRVRAELDPAAFFRHAHRVIYEALLEMAPPVDLVTLSHHLAERGQLDQVGGPVYLAALLDGLPRSAHLGAYVRIVREAARRRRVAAIGRAVANKAPSDPELEALVEQADAALIGEMADSRLHDRVADAETVAAEGVGLLERLVSGEGIGLRSGFTELDQITRGLLPGQLVLLAARPGMGKTALALTAARQIAQAGSRVAIVSLEMARQELFLRLLTQVSHVDLHQIASGRIPAAQYGELAEAACQIGQLPLSIIDRPTLTVSQIRALARQIQAVRTPPLALVVVDYLQLIVPEHRHESRVVEIGEISRRLKALARELEVPVVCSAQLSRAVEGRSDKRPVLSDLRDSGCLEQDADLVLLLYRPGYYSKTPDPLGQTELVVAKHRNGPTGTVRLRWRPELMLFENT